MLLALKSVWLLLWFCSETEWDFQWADREWVYEIFDSVHLDGWQKVNHFRNAKQVRTVLVLTKSILF